MAFFGLGGVRVAYGSAGGTVSPRAVFGIPDTVLALLYPQLPDDRLARAVERAERVGQELGGKSLRKERIPVVAHLVVGVRGGKGLDVRMIHCVAGDLVPGIEERVEIRPSHVARVARQDLDRC